MRRYTRRRTPENRSLDELLRRLNWTGADLMHHIGVTKNTVTSWRRGHIRVPKVVLLYLELLLKYQATFAYEIETHGPESHPVARDDAPRGGQDL